MCLWILFESIMHLFNQWGSSRCCTKHLLYVNWASYSLHQCTCLCVLFILNHYWGRSDYISAHCPQVRESPCSEEFTVKTDKPAWGAELFLNVSTKILIWRPHLHLLLSYFIQHIVCHFCYSVTVPSLLGTQNHASTKVKILPLSYRYLLT